jgi:hypothetical protein
LPLHLVRHFSYLGRRVRYLQVGVIVTDIVDMLVIVEAGCVEMAVLVAVIVPMLASAIGLVGTAPAFVKVEYWFRVIAV